MNSNGIPEMIRAAGKSKYRTPEIAWWGGFLIGLGLGLSIGLWVSSARASPSCMTYREAREVWPNTYLFWRGEHCWTAGNRHHAQVQHITPLPKRKPFVLLLEQAVADPSFDTRWRARIDQ